MKKGIFIIAYGKFISNLLFLIALLFLLGEQSTAQTILYKKDSTTLTVSRIDTTGKIRSYSLPSDNVGVNHLISKNALDSIRYPDGHTERFTWSDYQAEEQQIKSRKNFIGTKIFPLFYSKPNLYYERLIIGEDVGLKFCFLIDTGNENIYYGTVNEKADYYGSAGLNYYFLHSSISRFGTGLTFLSGEFFEEYYENSFLITGPKSYSGILWNINFSYIFLQKIYASLSYTVPIDWKLTYLNTYFELELSLNF